MNYGLIIICDEDSDYAESLADYFRLKGCLASDMVVFTDYDRFASYAEGRDIDILLINENQYDIHYEALPENNTFILRETPLKSSSYNQNSIYKYSSGDEILRIVMAAYNPNINKHGVTFHKYKNSKLIGVCSPLGSSGKTSFGLSLGIALSNRYKCLFLSFDSVSPLKAIMENYSKSEHDITHLLYYFLQSPQTLDNHILSNFVTYENLDFIPPSDESGTFSELSTEELASFLSKIADTGKYNYIVVDFGPLSFLLPLLKLCDKLLLVEYPENFYSSKKMELYINSLTKQNSDTTLPFNRVNPPSININSSSSDYLFSVSSGPLAHFTSSVIDELKL